MNLIKYPSDSAVNACISAKEPMLVLISFDGETVIMACIDDAPEHSILLGKLGMDYRDIDKYFRIVLDADGADWTFICPPDYRDISDKTRRITRFYLDGFTIISNVLQSVGYLVGINIPKRYRRHFDMMGDATTVE